MTKIKICTKCKEELSITEFGTNKANKNGLKSWCRACVALGSKKYRDNNKEKTRAADVVRNKTAARKASHNIHAQTYRKKFPKVVAAHTIVRNAIKSGKMINPECCSECDNTENIQFHHPDYSRPLHGVFVCAPCHNKQPAALNRT